MKHDKLEANDEPAEPTRESGIFSDLAVRQHSDHSRSVSGVSIPPPPPPRTRSSILPVARSAEEPQAPSLDDEDFFAFESQPAQHFDDALPPIQVHAPSTLIRPEPDAVARIGTQPPAPPRTLPPALPGTSFPSAQPVARGRSIPPGTRPTSALVANAIETLPSMPPPAARDTSGTFQKQAPERPSQPTLQRPLDVKAPQVAYEHFDDPYASGPVRAPSSNQLRYAIAFAATLVVACVAWLVLDAKPVPGVVQLTTQPADATVIFDGKAVGSISPFLETGVLPGQKHTLEVKKPGFKTWAQQVEVQPGQTLVFAVELPAEADPAAPRTVPMAAAAEPVAKAAPVAALAEVAPPAAILPSEPEQRAEPASEPRERSSRRARRAASSQAESGASGTLRVSSRPWSVVTIDGKLIGNTPQMNLTLSEGTHRVQLSNPEFKVEKVVNVSIAAGKTETLIVNLL